MKTNLLEKTVVNHKGGSCIYRLELLCQEGYCSECAIPNQKRILIDIDGVICQYDFPKIVKDFFGIDLSSQAIYAYDLADVLGVAPVLINTMFKGQVYGKPNFNDHALETLKEWKAKGYEIAIFSNRVKYMGEYGLLEWLIDNKIPFSGIDVLGNGIYDFHIDDSPSKLATTNSKTKLLFNQPWNSRCVDVYKQFTRVFNWQEISKIA